MLLRREPGGALLAITQPAHAALAGRLAKAWDDDLPPALVPATHHHDDVWEARDAAPVLLGDRPQAFFELAPGERATLWARAPKLAAPLGPEAELWVLRHAVRLHERATDAGVQAMAARLAKRADAVLEELRAVTPGFDAFALARGTSLLALFDALAHALCAGVREPTEAGVLRLTPAAAGAVGVAPWPFVGRRVDSHVEARRLPAAVGSQAELDAAWARASVEELPVALVPA